MMYVVADPELFEIEEMLDVVAQTHRLSDILPLPTHDCSVAEHLKRGWCYLFYDADTFLPLGYAAFEWYGDSEIPHFMFGTTRFAKPCHILSGKRAMFNVIRNSLKNRVHVYIDDERIAALALKCGFRRASKNGAEYRNIFIKER